MERPWLRLISAIACLGFACHAVAGPRESGRIAIIDVSKSLIAGKSAEVRGKVFEHLRNSGVLVIGRYYSRCAQKAFWRKRLIDGDPDSQDGEAQAILRNGFAIMSIYQYNNRHDKFSGDFSGPVCGETKYADAIRKASPQAREGILDAEAAIDQARIVKQPKGSAVYFGVDYNFDKTNPAEARGLVEYFSEVKKQFDQAGYRIGAYASGDALKILLGDNREKKVLIDLAWLLPSASFSGNSDFHTNRHWHLFQSQADNKVLLANDGACREIEYDVNIQNVAAGDEDLGFWSKDGAYKVPRARTEAIFEQRRFVCDRRNLTLSYPVETCTEQPKSRSCAATSNGEPCFARTVRVDPEQADGAEARIDFRDYGRFDGGIARRRLTRSLATKPLYEKAPWVPALCPQ